MAVSSEREPVCNEAQHADPPAGVAHLNLDLRGFARLSEALLVVCGISFVLLLTLINFRVFLRRDFAGSD